MMGRIKITNGDTLLNTKYVQIEGATQTDVIVVATHEERMIAQVEHAGLAASPEGRGYSATKGKHAVGWLDNEHAMGGWYEGSSEDWTVQNADGRLYTSERDPETGRRLLLAAVRAGTIAADGFAIISIGMTFPSEIAGEPEVFVPVDTTLHSQAHYWQADGDKLNGIPIYQPLASGSAE